jgi:hypothetical protein
MSLQSVILAAAPLAYYRDAGAVIRRIAAAIFAAALPVPDSNPTGTPVVLSFATAADGERSVTVSGGTLTTPNTVII